MMTRRRLMIAAVPLIVWSSASAQPSPPQTTVIRAARLVDVKTGAVMAPASVIVTGTRITGVGPSLAAPAGAATVDLGNATLLPGLIDCYTHLLQNFDGRVGPDEPNMLLTVAALGTTRRALLGAAMGRQDLEA